MLQYQISDTMVAKLGRFITQFAPIINYKYPTASFISSTSLQMALSAKQPISDRVSACLQTWSRQDTLFSGENV